MVTQMSFYSINHMSRIVSYSFIPISLINFIQLIYLNIFFNSKFIHNLVEIYFLCFHHRLTSL
jgi:hypothetical protein